MMKLMGDLLVQWHLPVLADGRPGSIAFQALMQDKGAGGRTSGCPCFLPDFWRNLRRVRGHIRPWQGSWLALQSCSSLIR